MIRIEGRLGGLASLGPLGARLYERHFEANFSYGYEKLAKKKRAQRRNKISNGRQKATGGNGRQQEAAAPEGTAEGKSNRRKWEATGSLRARGTSRRQKQREATGSHRVRGTSGRQSNGRPREATGRLYDRGTNS